MVADDFVLIAGFSGKIKEICDQFIPASFRRSRRYEWISAPATPNQVFRATDVALVKEGRCVHAIMAGPSSSRRELEHAARRAATRLICAPDDLTALVDYVWPKLGLYTITADSIDFVHSGT